MAATVMAVPPLVEGEKDSVDCSLLAQQLPLQLGASATRREEEEEEGGGGGRRGEARAAEDDASSCPCSSSSSSSSSSTASSSFPPPSPFLSPPGDHSTPAAVPFPPPAYSEVPKHTDRGSQGKTDTKKCRYRSQLEREVQKLREQLQEEIDLHVALANAIGYSTSTSVTSSCNLPDKAQELLANITALEITVSKLEEELASLHLNLTQERNERHLAEYHLGHSPSLSLMPTCCFSDYSWEERISSLRAFKSVDMPRSLDPDTVAISGQPQSIMNSPSNACRKEKGSPPCSSECEDMEMDLHLEQVDSFDSLNENFLIRNIWHHPNQLSEEMVRCMRNIFLSLSESSNASSKMHSPPTDMLPYPETIAKESTFDPYGVHGKVNWPNIGTYGSAAEVSWMVVGKKQLEYAAEALRIFRFLVDQLAKVNPAAMNCNQKLAFWINLYNALIMHAYLAYGVPRSDIKLFSLMQKVSYTVGGQSITAADIEYVILKMKPPAYRPQIALILALHKFKISEEHKKFSIDNPEPLAVFAISCGMYSSPVVRIFTANKVKEELQNSFRDYVRASVGISDKGKLLVPKLLHCFAKGVVEDSLLVDWISRFLSPEQAAEVRNSTSHRKQRLLGARSFCIVPFDSRFRYLFLPDNKSSRRLFLV